MPVGQSATARYCSCGACGPCPMPRRVDVPTGHMRWVTDLRCDRPCMSRDRRRLLSAAQTRFGATASMISLSAQSLPGAVRLRGAGRLLPDR